MPRREHGLSLSYPNPVSEINMCRTSQGLSPGAVDQEGSSSDMMIIKMETSTRHIHVRSGWAEAVDGVCD